MVSNRRAQGPVVNLQPAGSARPDGYFWGRPTKPRPPSESPYKELLSGRMESGLSASLSLLREAGSFASTQHLRPVSLTNLTPAP